MTVTDKVARRFGTGVRKKTEFVRKEESLRRCGEGGWSRIWSENATAVS